MGSRTDTWAWAGLQCAVACLLATGLCAQDTPPQDSLPPPVLPPTPTAVHQKPSVEDGLLWANECFKAYKSQITLRDTAAKKVTEASVKRFEELFGVNARVFNDLERRKENVYFKDYASRVYSCMPKGVKAAIHNESGWLRLRFLHTDTTGNTLVYEREFDKVMFSGTDRNCKPVDRSPGLRYRLRCVVHVILDEKRAYISTITLL